mmetsp:Transcript_17420/g.28325  ORF Transcript_17420/g.28325 Transcript_17420/m.28325 type:complete len:453 (-) Transcript_17420:253-1611(-)
MMPASCSSDGVFECPSRYLCYDGVAFNSTTTSACLCNRVHLIYGNECQHTSWVAQITILMGFVLTCYALRQSISAFRKINRGRVSRMKKYEVIPCLYSVFLNLFLVIPMGFDLARAFSPTIDDRWWEKTGFNYVSGAVLFLACMLMLALAQMFLSKVASSEFDVAKMKTKINLCQMILLPTVLAASFLLHEKSLVFMFQMAWVAVVLSILTASAFKVKKILATSAAANSDNNTQPVVYRAYQDLQKFIDMGQRWVALWIILGSALTVLSMNLGTPAWVAHASHALLTFTQARVTLVQVDYFLLPLKRPTLGVDVKVFFAKAKALLAVRRASLQQRQVLPAPTRSPKVWAQCRGQRSNNGEYWRGEEEGREDSTSRQNGYGGGQGSNGGELGGGDGQESGGYVGAGGGISGSEQELKVVKYRRGRLVSMSCSSEVGGWRLWHGVAIGKTESKS